MDDLYCQTNTEIYRVLLMVFWKKWSDRSKVTTIDIMILLFMLCYGTNTAFAHRIVVLSKKDTLFGINALEGTISHQQQRRRLGFQLLTFRSQSTNPLCHSATPYLLLICTLMFNCKGYFVHKKTAACFPHNSVEVLFTHKVFTSKCFFLWIQLLDNFFKCALRVGFYIISCILMAM